ncbi:PaaI family thioesterase [Marmoricola sp. RAF53]|uniref:PaaI family thioesterase n=1 Tax=Marmoricola sp. RAF53 TaxID=3233059 RepID=UPI003F9761B1
MTQFQQSDDPTLGLGADRPGGFPDQGFDDEVADLTDPAGLDPYAEMVTNLRSFLDYVAAAKPDDLVLTRLAFDLAGWRDRLAADAVSEREQLFAHRFDLPGRGQTMSPAFVVRDAGPERVTGTVRYGRYFLGGNGAVHGGAIPLLFDEVFGRLVNGHRTPSRTAYLRADYRAVTPVGQVLDVDVWVERIDGRKRYVRGVLKHGETVTAEAEALFVELRPGQP